MSFGVGHITKNSTNVFSACRKRRLKETGRGDWESPPLLNFPQRQHEGSVCFFCVVGYPPNWGKRPRYIDRIDSNTFICIYLVYSWSFISFGAWVLSLLFCLLAVQLSRS